MKEHPLRVYTYIRLKEVYDLAEREIHKAMSYNFQIVFRTDNFRGLCITVRGGKET